MLKYIKCLIFTCIFINLVIFTQGIRCHCKNVYVSESADRVEKHWWGYRRYVTNEQVSRISSQFDFLAAELGFVGGISIPISFLNPFAGIFVSSVLELSSSYYWLLSTYVSKINRGNGVIIDFSNGIVFRIIGI